ncbi:hypothetical protein [Halorubrum salinum]|mgnify:CR=1 FL=1|uniref:hypothetical protein n=1 Tax=Halorubrum salinum TaxID=767517 RepID=UPI0021129838|nr:hypothetical protein [Halorubrum salinum]
MSGDEGAERPGEGGGTDGRRDGGASADSYPIEGAALVTSAALASVPASRLPELLARVQADLGPRIDAYRRRYERIAADADREAFLVEPDHWESIAERLDLDDRERDAVVRAHEAAVVRVGGDGRAREEFETALEIRSGVVIGVEETT